MTHCVAEAFFDELYSLTEKLHDRQNELIDAATGNTSGWEYRPLGAGDHDRLKALLHRWRRTPCPDSGCRVGKCAYARPYDWINFYGYRNLGELLTKLKSSKRGHYVVGRRRSADALDAGRRPGHYNP